MAECEQMSELLAELHEHVPDAEPIDELLLWLWLESTEEKGQG